MSHHLPITASRMVVGPYTSLAVSEYFSSSVFRYYPFVVSLSNHPILSILYIDVSPHQPTRLRWLRR